MDLRALSITFPPLALAVLVGCSEPSGSPPTLRARPVRSMSGQPRAPASVTTSQHIALQDECDSTLSDPRADLVVARVITTIEKGATNAHPPQVVLHVEQIINGNLPKGELRATWQPYSASILCAVGEEEAIARWNATPLAGPKPGERFLLAGWRSKSDYSVEGWCARAATPSNIDKAKSGLAHMRAVQASTARAEKAARDADGRVQAAADLRVLYRSADVVMLATQPSEALGDGVSDFTFRVLRRFKDSGLERPSDAPFVYVRMSNVAHRQLTQRLSWSRRMVLFLRTVPKREWHTWETQQQQLDNIDHRRFVPVESTVSVLEETAEITNFLERPPA